MLAFPSPPLREQERTVEEGIALRAWSSWKRRRKGKGVIRAKGEQVIPDEGGEARNKKGRGGEIGIVRLMELKEVKEGTLFRSVYPRGYSS